MKSRSNEKLYLCIEYALVLIIIAFFVYWILDLREANLTQYPLGYNGGGDGATGMVTVKSMLENGWIYENPRLGAPNGAEYYDATTMESFLSAIEQVMVLITGNWVLTYNLFYILGYLLAGVTALYALKQLKIPGLIAVPSAILYSFLPYHFIRSLGHMYLGMYFMVPIMVLYLYRLMQGELLFHKGKKGWITVSNVLRLITLMIMSLTGIYYTFFTCFFLCVVILYSLLNQCDWKQVRQACFSIGVMIITLLLAAMPNFIYWLHHGRAQGLALKGREGAELYGLKIIQLVLPRSFHRFELFAKLKDTYDNVYPLVNENGSASLGIIMAIGFVVLCAVLFIGKKIPNDSNLRVGSVLNIAAVLFATIGGYSVLLSFLTGAIRCHNRISVFIAMFSLIAVDTLLLYVYEKWVHKTWQRCIYLVAMVGMLLFGIWDQTIPTDSTIHQVYASRFEEDATFVAEIETSEAEGAMIYQMPYMKYPENGGIQQMPDYAHLIGYLHSDTLRWSYGAPEGREGDLWLQSVNALAFEEQIVVIEDAGFAGIYIDWNAYLPDERIVMESILSEKVNASPIVNASGNKAYYSFQ